MLNERPGCFMRLGTVLEDRQTFTTLSAQYVFNDDVLPIAASY